MAFFQNLSDRYISLANVFMMFFVSYLAHTYLQPYAVYILIALGTYYVTQLNITMKMYKSIDDFFDYQLYFYPEMARNRIIRANAFLIPPNPGMQPDISGAWILIRDGLEYNPNDFETLYKAAICCRAIGQFPKAKEFIDKAEKNFYIGQEHLQGPRLQRFRNSIIDIKRKIKQIQKQEEGNVKGITNSNDNK